MPEKIGYTEVIQGKNKDVILIMKQFLNSKIKIMKAFKLKLKNVK